MAEELIFHHYDYSNFSEKVRLVFGRKGLAWRSVTIPSVAPKPDYTALTGGYRRTPALQIGAEIFCDTALIAEELERRFPTPTLYPGPSAAVTQALSAALAIWAETRMCWPAALYITGIHADRFPDSFHRDRAAFHGKPPPTRDRIRAAAQRNLVQLRPQLAWVHGLLEGGGPFVLGGEPSLADFAIYHPLWLMDQLAGAPVPLVSERVRGWMARVAAIGHGTPTECSPAAAIAVAAQSEPPAPRPSQRLCGDPEVGARIAIRPTDYGRSDATEGRLESIDATRVSVARRDPRAGDVVVHFPRLGYRVQPLGDAGTEPPR